MRTLILGIALVAAATLAAAGQGIAANACPRQYVHTYGLIVSNGNDRSVSSETTASVGPGGTSSGSRAIHVADSNTEDCNGDKLAGAASGPDGVPGDFDGDYDVGEGGAFFGYGQWSTSCGYDLHQHTAGYAIVVDRVFGYSVPYLLGEDDRTGPAVVNGVCVTSGSITPAIDADDCLSDDDAAKPGYQPYGISGFWGGGHTCGTGGGDGGYWVILLDSYVDATVSPTYVANVPTSGTIEAL